MANITFAVDESVLAEAKAFAAEHGTSLNRLVASFLGSVRSRHPRQAVSQAQQVCLDYSLGKRTLTEGADALGLQDAGLFLALMRQTGLPLPKLGEDLATRQADETYDVFGEAFGLTREPSSRKSRAAKRR